MMPAIKCGWILLILLTYGSLNNVSSVNHVGVNEIQSGANFANSLAKAMESKNFAGVIGKVTSIIPGVSAVVSFLGFVLSFFGTMSLTSLQR